MATEVLDARLNARLSRRIKSDLVALARRRRVDESELARTLLDEALRRENHPGLVFRASAAGREAAIEGRRLYVWQVMETLWASEGQVVDAAEFLGLRVDQVDAAVAYYTDYADEIDAVVTLNREEADRLEDLVERQAKAKRR